AQLSIPSLIEDPISLQLCATTHMDSLQVRNVKVDGPILYFELNWGEESASNTLQLVYRDEDDQIQDQRFLLKLE
ncbi:MAG: hypothetical protein AAFQ68_18005, partial [Bacteroidota bacterium]